MPQEPPWIGSLRDAGQAFLNDFRRLVDGMSSPAVVNVTAPPSDISPDAVANYDDILAYNEFFSGQSDGLRLERPYVALFAIIYNLAKRMGVPYRMLDWSHAGRANGRRWHERLIKNGNSYNAFPAIILNHDRRLEFSVCLSPVNRTASATKIGESEFTIIEQNHLRTNSPAHGEDTDHRRWWSVSVNSVRPHYVSFEHKESVEHFHWQVSHQLAIGSIPIGVASR